MDGLDGVAGKPFVSGEQLELAIHHVDQAFRRTNPKRAGTIDQECANVITLELRCVLLIEKRKLEAVEPSQSLFGADPNVSIPGLSYRVNGVLR